jgi:hypothetical protein
MPGYPVATASLHSARAGIGAIADTQIRLEIVDFEVFFYVALVA